MSTSQQANVSVTVENFITYIVQIFTSVMLGPFHFEQCLPSCYLVQTSFTLGKNNAYCVLRIIFSCLNTKKPVVPRLPVVAVAASNVVGASVKPAFEVADVGASVKALPEVVVCE